MVKESLRSAEYLEKLEIPVTDARRAQDSGRRSQRVRRLLTAAKRLCGTPHVRYQLDAGRLSSVERRRNLLSTANLNGTVILPRFMTGVNQPDRRCPMSADP
jgi:hypothetical protein